MDNLKTFAVPVVALVILLVWFFLIRPMLDEQDDAAAEPDQAGQQDQAGESDPAPASE